MLTVSRVVLFPIYIARFSGDDALPCFLFLQKAKDVSQYVIGIPVTQPCMLDPHKPHIDGPQKSAAYLLCSKATNVSSVPWPTKMGSSVWTLVQYVCLPCPFPTLYAAGRQLSHVSCRPRTLQLPIVVSVLQRRWPLPAVQDAERASRQQRFVYPCRSCRNRS
jgi:hypothetical protein